MKQIFKTPTFVLYMILIVLGGILLSDKNDTVGGFNTVMSSASNATYSTSTEPLENGEESALRIDVNGNLLGSMGTRLDETNDSVTTHEKAYSYSYVSAPTANTVVKSTAGKLVRIILGAWVTGGTVECSDHATDGDGNVKIFLTAGATDESGFPKSVDIGANFATGITCDTIGLTQVTFIYE